jgi:phage-related tail protein
MGKLKTYQQQIQEIVEKGINTAETQQKKLSAKPFEYAEKLESGAREYSVKSLREHYYGYSETLFSQLRSLNLRMGNFAADILSKLEKEAAEGTDAVAETVSDVADDVSSAAQSTKDKVNTKKSTATKTPAKKTATAASV